MLCYYNVLRVYWCAILSASVDFVSTDTQGPREALEIGGGGGVKGYLEENYKKKR